MDFRLEFDPPSPTLKLDLSDRIFLIGSCFTEHMYDKLNESKFRCIQNPHGVLFNPISIFNALEQYLHLEKLESGSFFEAHGLWNHWDFHSSHSHQDLQMAIKSANAAISNGNAFLKKANWLFITLGSAFVYSFENNRLVANCHKVPAAAFSKRKLSVEEITTHFNRLYLELKGFNPNINIMLTISPVRHLRDGFIENNRSKAILIQAVDSMVSAHTDVQYFPSYELIVDDLRDYRFYAEDMTHPNYLATRYVWEKFMTGCINGQSRECMKEIGQLGQAMKHKVMHPGSAEHLKFKDKFRQMAVSLSKRLPDLDFTHEIAHFS